MLKILVTGSTGFLGSHLVKALIRKNLNVRCFVKNGQKAGILPDDCEIFVGDITDDQSCYRATKDIDIVCHLAAQMRKKGIPEKDYWKVNVRGTKNILLASLKENVRQFIHCSTASIIGPIKDATLDESYPNYDCSNTYKLTKVMAEKMVLSRRDRIPITILSPEFIYGPGCLHYLPLLVAIKEKKIAIAGSGKNIHQPTYVSDVVQGFLLAINNKRVIGERFIIAGEERITSEALIMKMAKIMGLKFKPYHIPLWPLKLLSPILPVPQGVVDFFSNDHMYSIKKAKNILNYKPRVNLEHGIKNTVEWFNKIYSK